MFKVILKARLFSPVFVLIILCFQTAFTQVNSLDYYLPDNVKYDPSIPTPQSFLGYEIGDWHIGHDQLVYYMKALAEKSDRIEFTEYARSHENRPLIYLTISSTKNIKRVDELRANHLKALDSSSDSNENPLVVLLGHTVHGNESSGANSAVLTAYFLAAAKGDFVDDLLDKTIVLLDPCFNPDGMNRFASWVNTHKSSNLNPDNNDREFNEVWPGGRTNHYWFDLNRDWLLLQHPESRGRIKYFHEWKPNVLTDAHEMGTNNTYFFQPGIPSRNNPLTPKNTFVLTEELAYFHAAALDSIGSLYYTKESFDDFYIGKGSTYPDINGSVGILFEQASSRGHLQNSQNGLVSFPFTIRNQFNTAISTLKGSLHLKDQLLKHQKEFYKSAKKIAKADKIKSYSYGTKNEMGLCSEMNKILDLHQIDYNEISEDKSKFKFQVSTNQDQYRLIKSLFERNTEFKDSLFYDVSTWTLPLAFNVSYEASKKGVKISREKEREKEKIDSKFNIVHGDLKTAYACLIKSNELQTPKLIYELLSNEVQVRVATESLTMETSEGKKVFSAGTILVPLKSQEEKRSNILSIINKYASENFGEIYALKTGLSPEGIDFGSPSFRKMKLPKIGLIVGEGVNAYEAGEIWFTLDKRFNIPVSKLDIDDIDNMKLTDYNVLLMVRGAYGKVSQGRMKSWIMNGGILITQTSASSWLAKTEFCTFNVTANKDHKKLFDGHYHSIDEIHGAQNIGGVILQCQADLSHPLFYGYQNSMIPVFKNHKNFYKTPVNKFAAPLKYYSNPLLSGYISKNNLMQISGTPAVLVGALGSGRIIAFSDNPNFRAYFLGTNKMFMNAIFFGHIINSRSTE